MNLSEHKIIIPQESRESKEFQRVAGIPLKQIEALAMEMPLSELKTWIRFFSKPQEERKKIGQQILQYLKGEKP